MQCTVSHNYKYINMCQESNELTFTDRRCRGPLQVGHALAAAGIGGGQSAAHVTREAGHTADGDGVHLHTATLRVRQERTPRLCQEHKQMDIYLLLLYTIAGYV